MEDGRPPLEMPFLHEELLQGIGHKEMAVGLLSKMAFKPCR
jgi:hypothetical protein